MVKLIMRQEDLLPFGREVLSPTRPCVAVAALALLAAGCGVGLIEGDYTSEVGVGHMMALDMRGVRAATDAKASAMDDPLRTGHLVGVFRTTGWPGATVTRGAT
jgi:hypothetical protein